MTLTIITNNHKRELIFQHELSESERSEFDWVDFDDENSSYSFFRYKSNLYCFDEFMRIEHHPDSEFSSWGGYMGETYFSGILVKHPTDHWDIGEYIIVGRYYS